MLLAAVGLLLTGPAWDHAWNPAWNPAWGTARAAGLIGARALGSVVSATDARLNDRGDAAELTFALSRAVEPTAFTLSGPDRVILDLPQVAFEVDLRALDAGRLADEKNRRGKPASRSAAQGPDAKGLIASVRFGLLAPGRSRVVIDLAQPARIVSAKVVAVQGGAGSERGGARLIVELARTDRSSFEAGARAPAPAANGNASPAVLPVAAAGRLTVVIDPGHGGPDNGAVRNGVIEKELTLAFARTLAAKLEAGGRLNVVLTRAADVFIPLSERVRIARAAGAALMISVHADTLPGSARDTAEVSGATVYTVSDRASDAYAATVAAKENAADAAVGVAGQADTADVNDILFDLTRQETRAYSHVFARTLVNYLKIAGRLNKNPQRSAGFVVLKAPDVPSVLVELGYLSSAADAASFLSDDWRDKATGRMAEAVETYFAEQHGTGKAAAAVLSRQLSADLAK